MIFNKDGGNTEKQIIDRYLEIENSIKHQIKNSTVEMKKVNSEEVVNVVNAAWDLEHMNQIMLENNIDVEKLPLGKLSKEQIVKGYKILGQIQKILFSGEKGKENVIIALSNDFYSVIPHNFGIKKPVMVDHLQRIKEKLKVLEILTDI